jgi:hypothetical protein
MTPVEWNDSEPGFPDFLPPKPTGRRHLSDTEVRERIEGILKASGIKIQCVLLDVCAHFPDGTYAFTDGIDVFADGLNFR